MGFNNDGADKTAKRLEKLKGKGDWPKIPIAVNLGKSKIPRSQIFVSVFDLIVMKLNDLFNIKNINKSKISYKIDYKCNECSNDLMIYYNKNSYKCLNCNILNEIN